MKKNQNLKKNKDEVIKESSPWTVIGSFPTYSEAAKKVDEVWGKDSDYDYKIKRYEKDFRVKKRIRKDLLENEKSNKKRKS